MASMFGFELKRKTPVKQDSIVPPASIDGSTAIVQSALSEYYNVALDLDGTFKNESELIRRYREISLYSDCDAAIDEVCNEVIVSEDDGPPIELELDDVELSDSIKKKIVEEFNNVIDIIDFKSTGYDMFRNWYVDGRIYYHILLDPKNIKNGINEVRYIDPRKIRKIKEVKKTKSPNGVEVVSDIKEYYLFNDKGLTEKSTNGTKLSVDSVAYITSGLVDANTNTALSYLHKALKPVNQLRFMEDATVIYTISRAPERRIFYIDVGDLPKVKAEQYVADVMNKYRNKITYDASTGEVTDTKKHMSMLEDFWMPRRSGSKGTEITTLQGGNTLTSIENVNYFQQKLYAALNVPIGRLQPATGFNIGRSSEITRDELKFAKFTNRLKRKFGKLFLDLLRVQLITKGIMTQEDWEEIQKKIVVKFQKDNYFAELKDSEILMGKLQNLQSIDPFIGRIFSRKWAMKNAMMLDDDEQKEMMKEIIEESKDELAELSIQNQMDQNKIQQSAEGDPNE